MNNNNSAIRGVKDHNNKISESESNVCLTSQQVSFFDSEVGYTNTINSRPDSSYNIGGTDTLTLNRWLERPLKIHEFTWAEGAEVTEIIKPWHLFFNNTSVKDKISNYAYVRCKLRVKMVVNGSPSLYGKMMAVYTPLQDTVIAPNTGGATVDLVSYSQRPHVWLDTATGSGGCLCLPFFYNKNWLDITLAADMAAMGEVRFRSTGSLLSTAVTTDVVTVSVFAWAEEISLAQTTGEAAMQSDIVLQADSFAGGPISTPASVVANVANKLKGVPVLGRFARATEIGATAIGSIASIFGFSRTPVIDNPGFMKNVPFGQLANTGTHELVDRLVLDPKQGLSVDPSSTGLAEIDEMTISYIATKETYIDQKVWNPSDAVDTVIYNINVTPSMFMLNPLATRIAPSALDFASYPFEYWRGDITYRIMVVASQFHRGRILVQWDPTGSLSDFDTNVRATHIIDLANTRDFEFTIPYGADSPWLRREWNRSLPNYNQNGHTQNGYNGAYSNGVVRLSVLNRLVSIPGANTGVRVMLLIKGGNNFEVAVPRELSDLAMPVHNSVELQSEIVLQSDTQDRVGDEENIPEGTPSSNPIVAVDDDNMDLTYSACMGEKIVSFRTLLKRYVPNFVTNYPAGTSVGPLFISSTISRWPVPRGLYPSGLHLSGVNACNYSGYTLFNYLQGAFAGMRGGSRWKFNLVSTTLANSLTVDRKRATLTTGGYAAIRNLDKTSSSTIAKTLVPPSNFSGLSLTNPRTQTGVEIEAPHYSRFRFVSPNPYGTMYGTTADETTTDCIRYEACIPDNVSGVNQYLQGYHAVADDFSFFFFLGAPTMYLTGSF